jgi:HEAT repeat protein
MPPTTTDILPEGLKAKRMAEIKAIFKDFLKVIKVVSLYPEGNPLPQSMRRSFAERLAQHIEDYGEIQVLVTRDTLTCDGETVYIDKTKEEALAAVFFESGITGFSMLKHFDAGNVCQLLEVIKTYINTPDKSQDMATLFWESGITRFTFTTLEDVALANYQGNFMIQELGADGSDGERGSRAFLGNNEIEPYAAIFTESVSPDSDSSEKRLGSDPDSGGSAGTLNLFADIPGLDQVADKTSEAAAAMGVDNLPATDASRINTSLILNDELRLSEEDEREIRRLVEQDADFDMWEATVELCKELLHQDTDLADFAESVTICSKVATELLRIEKLWHTTQLLQYMKMLEDKIRAPRPAWADKLQEVRQTFGSRERMELLGETLNLHPEIGSDELRRYLAGFDWQALAAVTELLGELESEAHREAVCDFLTATGRAHLQILSRGVTDKRPQAVRGAIIVLSRIGDPRAFGILKKAAMNENRSVRLELVTQLRSYVGPETLEILQIAATDADPDIRLAAINSISAQQGPAAFEVVGRILADPKFSGLSEDDRRRILVAFSKLGGEDAVPSLGAMIQRPNLLNKPMLTSMRTAAFEALAHNRSEQAERLLVQLTNSWRPDIRRQAQAALRHRREVIYGGINE